MEKNIDTYAKTLKELNLQISHLKQEWFRHLILVASGLLGILISLHTNSSMYIVHRVCFLTLLSLLALGILTGGLSIYSQIYYLKKGKKLYVEEQVAAKKENREPQIVLVPHLKIFLIAEPTTYVCFVLAILLLILYAILTLFP